MGKGLNSIAQKDKESNNCLMMLKNIKTLTENRADLE